MHDIVHEPCLRVRLTSTLRLVWLFICGSYSVFPFAVALKAVRLFLFPYQPVASYTSIDFASSFIRMFTGATSYDIRICARQDPSAPTWSKYLGPTASRSFKVQPRPLDEIVQLLNNSTTPNLDFGEHPVLFQLCFTKETHKELALYNLLTCKGSNTTRLLNCQSSNNGEDVILVLSMGLGKWRRM
jgi:hypothetical protein